MSLSGFYIDFSKLENFAYDADGNLILWRNGDKKNLKSVMKSGFQSKYSQDPNSLNKKVQFGTKPDKRPLVFTFNKDPGTTQAGAVGKNYTYKIKIPKADIEKFKFTDKNPEFNSRNSYPKFLSDVAKENARYYKQHPDELRTWWGTPATMKDTSVVTGLRGLNEQSKQIFKKRFKNLTDKEVAKLDRINRINQNYFPKNTTDLYNTDGRNKSRLTRLAKLNGVDVSENSFKKVSENTNAATSNLRNRLDYQYFKELSGVKGSPTTIIEGDIPSKYIQLPMKDKLSVKLSSAKDFMKAKVKDIGRLFHR